MARKTTIVDEALGALPRRIVVQRPATLKESKRIANQLMDRIAAQVAALPEDYVRQMLPILSAAEKEVAQDLTRWLMTATDADERFTAQRYRQALLQLRGAQRLPSGGKPKFPSWVYRLRNEMTGTLKAAGLRSGHLATDHLMQQMLTFNALYSPELRPIPLETAVHLKTANRMLIPRYRTSAARYAGNVFEDIKRQLSIGVVRGESVWQLTNRLQRLGGPKGLVATKGVLGEPHSTAEYISEGLFRKYRYWSERVVRTECLVGDTLVDAAVITAVHRRTYEGSVVEIVTAHGRKFTATPNHPMLTRRFWVCAGELMPGDYLVCNRREQNSSSASNKHVDRGPSSLGEIFDSVAAVGVCERRRTAQPDFHGDGMDGEVDIARPDRQLALGCFAPLNDPIGEQIFSPSHGSRERFCHECGGLFPINESMHLCAATQLDSGIAQNSYNRSVRQTERHRNALEGLSIAIPGHNRVGVKREQAWVSSQFECLGERPCLYSGFLEDQQHPAWTDSHCGGYSRAANSGEIEFDSVVTVRFRSFAGHVYNLSTPYGYYSISGVYTGNTINAYNQMTEDGITQIAAESEEKVLKRWDARADRRICMVCYELDGKTAEPGKPYPGGYDHPPAHPCCRCAEGMWLERWKV